MNTFLIFAYLFFIGSLFGWGLEVFYRHWFSSSNPNHKWINPGFCTGPYLPIYGFGLCTLYSIATLANSNNFSLITTIILIAVSMTVIEYFAGIVCLKIFKLRLWDYSNSWGNIQGLICPLFSFFWTILGLFYFFAINPFILDALKWLSENLAFSFVIGFFFGVFTIDVSNSAHLVVKIKKFADDKHIVTHLEQVKAHIRRFNEEQRIKTHFLFAFKTDANLREIMRNFYKK